MHRALLTLLVPAIACAGKDDDKKPADPLPPVTVIQPIDGAVAPVEAVDAGGVTQLPAFDPNNGFHLDDAPVARPGGRLPPREKKVAQIILRSTPSGAMAAVDGVRLGPTPVLWEGWLDGQPHEFTFVMAGHALARYRFVPITGGIVHGTLVKITDDKDAGVPEIPKPVTPPAPASVDGARRMPPERPPPTPTIDAPLPPSQPPVDAGVAPVGPF
jgi:hypothetical protein